MSANEQVTDDQIKALVRSHGENDDWKFYAVVWEVAQAAYHRGQIQFAYEILELVKPPARWVGAPHWGPTN